MVGKILPGVLIGGILLAGGTKFKTTATTKKYEIQKMQKEINEVIIPEEQPVYPKEEIIAKIMSYFINKGEKLDIPVSFEEVEEKEQTISIGEKKGKIIKMKLTSPLFLERQILNWINDFKEQFPCVLINKITITQKQETNWEIEMIVFGS
ncbi:MAG: hypothetical protein QXV73_04330 [Candidatus Micrarchaeia archaeon]